MTYTRRGKVLTGKKLRARKEKRARRVVQRKLARDKNYPEAKSKFEAASKLLETAEKETASEQARQGVSQTEIDQAIDSQKKATVACAAASVEYLKWRTRRENAHEAL